MNVFLTLFCFYRSPNDGIAHIINMLLIVKVLILNLPRFGVTLIGARREPKESQIFLNPGPNFKLAYDDTLFYIAITSEEDMALEELTKKSHKGKHSGSFRKDDGKRTRKLTRQSEWGSFISVIDNSEEEKNIEQSMPTKIFMLNIENVQARDIFDFFNPIRHISSL